jgi:Family of unknown function (DUF6088)
MKVNEKVTNNLQQIPEGCTFRCRDFVLERNEYIAASKIVATLVNKGTLKRLAQGIFYKPKQTIFGAIRPNETEMIKPFLFKNGQRVAYITGTSLYYQMGLTTQVAAQIIIASKQRRDTVAIGNLRIQTVKSYIEITEENYKLLQFLDALKDFNQIPDLDVSNARVLLRNKLNTFSAETIERLTKYALQYPLYVQTALNILCAGIRFKTYN